MGSVANDKFNIYYLEKFWELIPEVYRNEDGLDTNPNPNVLRALIEILAEQASIIRRSQDRLWEDQFIELCNEWAVPYIGDLLGTRLLSALNKRGRRIDVAKTIYYRRRKGTPRVLEELIHDISDWDGKLVEAFKRLVRARHGLDPFPELFPGMFTGTLPGGTADLRSPAGSELANSPFEEYFHLPDFRKPKGLDGRYGIPVLDFYLYRLYAYTVIDATPFKMAAGKFSFDPSGRSIPLFSISNRPERTEWDDWHSALEWELAAPIRCRLLAHAVYEITEAVIQQMVVNGLPSPQAMALLVYGGWKFPGETALLNHINFLTAAFFKLLLKFALIDACGKSQLLPASIRVTANAPLGEILREDITAANLGAWTVNGSNKILAIDPERGRLMFLNAPGAIRNVEVQYQYGFSGPTGAGTYDRKEVEDSVPTQNIPPGPSNIDLSVFAATEIVQVDDNVTYHIVANPPPIADFVFQSANQQRPYIILDQDLEFTTAGNDASLILDGLWIGSPGNKKFNIVLSGDYQCVIIRNCSIDPGCGTKNVSNEDINGVRILIRGNVENFCIQNSICGPVLTQNNGMIEDEIIISDSILQSRNVAVNALEISSSKTSLLRTTVFGSVLVHRLYATDSLITGVVNVTDTQAGCFRFSAAPKSSRLPHPYLSYLFELDFNHWFGTREFGQPHFAQLSDTAPVEIYRGAENGAEMGVFNNLINAIKFDGLKAKVEEYMPFGLIPAYINET